MGVAVISILSGPHFGVKNSFLGHCIAELWHKIVAEIYWKLYHYLYTKWTENFPVYTLTTKCANISVSTPKKGHSTRNWTTNHNMITIMKLSDDIKISPELLSLA